MLALVHLGLQLEMASMDRQLMKQLRPLGRRCGVCSWAMDSVLTAVSVVNGHACDRGVCGQWTCF